MRTNIAVTSPLAFVYDALDRLKQATRPLASSPDETFSYDAVGNRLRRDAQTLDAAFDPVNRLLSDANFNYIYDANGGP